MTQENKQAVIVVSHGSKNPKALRQFEKLVSEIQKKSLGIRVEGAFFQMAKPAVESVVKELIEEGYSYISFIPFFLMNGNHVQKDIPELIEILEKQFLQVTFNVGSILYPDKRLEDILVDRIKEVSL